MFRPNTWIFTASSPSVLGTVDVVTRFLAETGNYVDEIQSFDDSEANRFFIRVEFRPNDDAFSAEKFNDQFY